MLVLLIAEPSLQSVKPGFFWCVWPGIHIEHRIKKQKLRWACVPVCVKADKFAE